MIPSILNQIANEIYKSNISLSMNSVDGRINSIISENLISNFIKENFNSIEIPQIRSWYDIQIEKFYCNIKISNMTGNDNTIGKAVIYYFLTGLTDPPNHYDKFFKTMREKELEDENRDFYFIVVKRQTGLA